MPIDLSIIPEDFHNAVEQGQLPASSLGPALDEYVSTKLLDEVNAKRLPREQALPIFDQIRAKQKAQQQELERTAYRNSATVYAPESALGTTSALALSATPVKLWSHLFKSPLSWRQSITPTFTPAGLPLSLLFEAGMLGMDPLHDPLYQRGERGYAGSLVEAAKARMDKFEQAGKNTRERYGVAGAPIQAVQNLFNPVTGMAFAGKELYKALRGPKAEELAEQAEKDLGKYIGE